MKLYEVYEHPVLGLRAVKKGISWPAMLFNAFWYFRKAMWLNGLIVLSFLIGLIYLEVIVIQRDILGGILMAGSLQLGFLLVIAVNANPFYADSLMENGFYYISDVRARSDAEAIEFLKEEDRRYEAPFKQSRELPDKLGLAKEAYMNRDYRSAYELFNEIEQTEHLDSVSQRFKHQALMRIKLDVV